MLLSQQHYLHNPLNQSQNGLLQNQEKEYSIAAKTGTAERGDGTNNAWLVTFAPADNPQYVIVANRLKTTEIGKTLAPVVEDLYNTLFDSKMLPQFLERV